MNILWLCNVPPTYIYQKLGEKNKNGASWIDGALNELISMSDFELHVCAPMELKIYNRQIGERLYFTSFIEKRDLKYNNKLEKYFRQIITEVKPDIVHIFGTEYIHTLAMVRAFQNSDRTVINIQGLVSIYAKHYALGVNDWIKNRYTFRDILKHDNIKQQIKRFERKGKYEELAIKEVGNVIGRTEWDEACCKRINPKVGYYSVNEILRKPFYEEEKWDISKVQRHSIFLSQIYYPVKGMHFVLQALVELKEIYPDITVYYAGDFMKDWTISRRVRVGSYEAYLRSYIKKNHLMKYLVPLGNLDEYQMKQQFMKSHVFVSPSTIENESNSLSEAKILGCPVVVSYVGGVTKRVKHGEDGFLYQQDAPYMLAFYIKKIFDHDDIAVQISKNAIRNAEVVNDREKNIDELIKVYNNIHKTNYKMF